MPRGCCLESWNPATCLGAEGSPGTGIWALPRTSAPRPWHPSPGQDKSGKSFWGVPFLSPEPGRERQGGAVSRNPTPAGRESTGSSYCPGRAAAQPRPVPPPGAAATPRTLAPLTCQSPTPPFSVPPGLPAPSHQTPRLPGQLGWAVIRRCPRPVPPKKVKPWEIWENLRRELRAQQPQRPKGGGAGTRRGIRWGWEEAGAAPKPRSRGPPTSTRHRTGILAPYLEDLGRRGPARGSPVPCEGSQQPSPGSAGCGRGQEVRGRAWPRAQGATCDRPRPGWAGGSCTAQPSPRGGRPGGPRDLAPPWAARALPPPPPPALDYLALSLPTSNPSSHPAPRSEQGEGG